MSAAATVRRRPLVALAAAAAALIAAAVLIARALGADGAPPDTLAALVPADALIYAHVSTDPGRRADARLAARLQRLPTIRRLRDVALRRVGAGSPGFSFARDIRPWLGEEAAFALLPGARPGRADSLILARVGDRDLARVFIARAGAERATSYRDVAIQRLGDVSLAVAGDALLIGQDAKVRAAIDLSRGDGRPLAGAPAFARARAGRRPERRVVELYASPAGARGVLAARAGTLRGLLAAPELVALGATVTPAEDGIAIAVRAARTRPPAPGFAPALVRAAPRDAAGVLGLAGPDPLARRLLDAAPGLALVARGAGVDVEEDLLAPLRGGEVAVWATPGLLGPGVALAATTRDPQRTREALGRLQAPLAAALAPGDDEAGQVPLFEQREVRGVPVFGLDLAPGVELLYAVSGRRVVVSTSADAVARALGRGPSPPGLLDTAESRERIELPANGAGAVVFSDPGQLLALGDQIGITADPALQAVREDLRLLRTVSAIAQRSGTDTTAELFLELP